MIDFHKHNTADLEWYSDASQCLKVMRGQRN